MRVRFKKAVREELCHAEAGMELATGDLGARTMPAMGRADEVKEQPPRTGGSGGASPRRCETWTTSSGPSARTTGRPDRGGVRSSSSQGD
jgi:hypothetical protein